MIDLVGSGFPLRRLIAAAPVGIGTIFTDDAEAARLRDGGAATIMDATLLRTPAGLGHLRQRRSDWLVSINNMLLLPEDVLALYEGRALNCHPGLLPEYAGLHVHQWAIRNGETDFGVTVHVIEPGIDTGDIIGQRRFPIRPDDTGLSLFTRCVSAEVALCVEILDSIAKGRVPTMTRQDLRRRRLYRHREALGGGIDWRWPAARVIDFIRAGNYEPLSSPTYVAQMEGRDGRPIQVLRAERAGGTGAPPGTVVDLDDRGPLVACGDGIAIRITRARDRGQAMTLETWRRWR